MLFWALQSAATLGKSARNPIPSPTASQNPSPSSSTLKAPAVPGMGQCLCLVPTPKQHMRQFFVNGLVSVILSSWGHADMSVYVAVANNVRQGLCEQQKLSSGHHGQLESCFRCSATQGLMPSSSQAAEGLSARARARRLDMPDS